MPNNYKDKDGKDVEAYSTEEVDAKVKEALEGQEKEITDAVEKTNKEWETKTAGDKTKMETLEKEKGELETKLGGTGKQDENFKTLKDALDKKTKDIDDLKETMSKNEKARVQETVDTILNKRAGKDEELKKKVKHNYDEILKAMPGSTADEIAKRMDAAFKLEGEEPMDVIGGARNGGGGKGEDGRESGAEFTSREKQLGAKMGITDEDYKKYGGRLTKRK